MNYTASLKAIARKDQVVSSNCLILFCCDRFFVDGYDVTLHQGNKVLVLSELLQGKGGYIDKEIRRAHNVCKMFVAGSFRLREVKKW